MYARWTSFALGLGLVFSPLVLGYAEVGPILRDVALGLLVCVGTLAALEWPAARFLLAAPGLWMIWMGRASTDPAAAVVEVSAGGALALLALFPSGRLLPRLPAVRRVAKRERLRANA
jgi:hypothetical protein